MTKAAEEQVILIREFTPLDYPDIVRWWVERKENPPNLEDLPPLGAIAYDKKTDKPLAALWVYLDCKVEGKGGTGICFPHWLCSDPVNGLSVTSKAVGILEEFLMAEAKNMGYRKAITHVQDFTLATRFERRGFRIEHKPFYQLVKYL